MIRVLVTGKVFVTDYFMVLLKYSQESLPKNT